MDKRSFYISKKHVSSLAKKAREYAFNKKYGTYNYQNDYRSECPEWNTKFLKKILEYIPSLHNAHVLSVGSNNGSELYQIFNEHSDINFDVIEISETAVLNGRELFPEINFICHNYSDIYLNLKAAYCAGNDLDNIVKKAYDCLKSHGVMIFSISNGYIDVSNNSRKVIKGVYNPTTQECSNFETSQNLEWVRNAILTNGFTEIEIYDIDSEILLISRKN